ncbi:MAG TPA: ATP-binding protein [Anaerolineales bacterium]|nr:ATP-binding protein [Anaerolineales bacterium]
MKKRFLTLPLLRGLTAQLFVITILPLTLLLLLIAFGSYSMHQRDMRALVSERDERAVQSATAALESELHHRVANISNLATYVDVLGNMPLEKLLSSSRDLASDFDGGVVFLSPDGKLIASAESNGRLDWIERVSQSTSLASPSKPGPVISNPFLDPGSKQTLVVVSEYSPSLNMIVAGAFSPKSLAAQVLSASYPANSNAMIILVDSSRQVLFANGGVESQSLTADHPGVTEALRGESGTSYVKAGKSEHVVAYGPIPLTGWALLTEEDWQVVVSSSLQATQMAPLVLVPAFLLALIALWFGVRRIVQPLQRLESKAAALAWGDFETIQEPVGGIAEVQHLQKELIEMARKVQAAQEGLRDYIGAITSAQEEERMRLARDLHDDTIQAVIALKQRVQLAQRSVREKNTRTSLDELEALAEQTIENLRRLTRALRPIYLEDLGLVTALEMLANETSQANSLEISFRHSGRERRLSGEVELALYRIAQEALSNVVRHAKARHASLQIAFDQRSNPVEKEIRLEVVDDGIGFSVPKSPTDFAPSGHFGLLGIRERADLIGAKLEVNSEVGHGTRLIIHLPSSAQHLVPS